MTGTTCVSLIYLITIIETYECLGNDLIGSQKGRQAYMGWNDIKLYEIVFSIFRCPLLSLQSEADRGQTISTEEKDRLHKLHAIVTT